MSAVDPAGNLFIAVVMLVGLIGVVVPVLPGLWLSWLAVLIWSLFESSLIGWVVLVAATVLLALSQVVKFLIPGRRMRVAGVSWTSTAIGSVLGVVGFFAIPVIGLFIGFPLGVYLAERVRLGSHSQAWTSTVHALKAMGLSILIELGAGLLMAAAWLAGVVAS
jgi:uncharacterized protein